MAGACQCRKGLRFVPNGLRKTTLCLLLLAGCAGGLDDPKRFMFLGDADGGPAGTGGTGGGAGDPPACVTQFFKDSCNASVCHGAGQKLDLVSPGIATRLIDKPSADDSMCAGRTLVSSAGGESLLMKKLTDVDCGEKMPFGGMATATDIACVRGWVEGMATPGAGQAAGQ